MVRPRLWRGGGASERMGKSGPEGGGDRRAAGGHGSATGHRSAPLREQAAETGGSVVPEGTMSNLHVQQKSVKQLITQLYVAIKKKLEIRPPENTVFP